MNRRVATYGLLLSACALLVYFAPDPPQTQVDAVEVAGPGATDSQDSSIAPLFAAQIRLEPRADIVLGSSVDWSHVSDWVPRPVEPVQMAPQPEPPPTAPPLPYRYFGRMTDLEGRTLVFVVTQLRALVLLNEGEILDSVYKVESIQSAQIVFTYLPLGEQQILSTEATT